MTPLQQWESCSWGISAFWIKRKLFGGLFFNKKANVSAVRRQQQHRSQGSLQIEFVDCIYDTG